MLEDGKVNEEEIFTGATVWSQHSAVIFYEDVLPSPHIKLLAIADILCQERRYACHFEFNLLCEDGRRAKSYEQEYGMEDTIGEGLRRIIAFGQAAG